MIEHEHPTRAEVTDVANAVLDGSDAVMLSGETAVGRHPVAAVEILNRVLSATEAEHAARIAAERLQTSAVEAGDALSFAACKLYARVGANAIVAAVHDLAAAAAIARFRPAAPLLMVTDSESLWRALAVVCGVAPIYSDASVDPRSCATTARKWLLQRGLVAEGDSGVLLFASAPHITKPDTLQIVRFCIVSVGVRNGRRPHKDTAMSEVDVFPPLPRKILLATDLSARCDRALDRAGMLADQWDAELIAPHAVEDRAALQRRGDIRAPSWRRPPDPLVIAERQLRRDLQGLGRHLTTIVNEGDPADVIATRW